MTTFSGAPEPTPSCSLAYALPDETHTEKLGGVLAQALIGGMVCYLEGDLGAGKTSLCRALIRATGHQGTVKSPSYTLVEVYPVSRLYLYHFDFYRFKSPEEFVDAGFGEYFNETDICLVEWPDRAFPHLPAADVRCVLSYVDEHARRIEFFAQTIKGQQCLNTIRPMLEGANGWAPLQPL